MSFIKKYSQIIFPVQENIDKVCSQIASDLNLPDPLKAKVSALLNAPSKHIRAAVSFLYLKALGEDINERQTLLQIAVELVHNASLIHDDVIDDATERRTQKALNIEFGNQLAVISGDYLLSIALKKICMLNSFELTEMFAKTLDVMCRGEINQYFGEYKIPTISEYIEKSEQKTASLFETAVCGSLMLADIKIDASNFARNFGIAFQIRDDLINAKTTKSDIKNGVYTAPVIYSQNPDDIDEGIEKTVSLLNNYVEKVLCSLENIEDNIYKQKLVELARLLADEEY